MATPNHIAFEKLVRPHFDRLYRLVLQGDKRCNDLVGTDVLSSL